MNNDRQEEPRILLRQFLVAPPPGVVEDILKKYVPPSVGTVGVEEVQSILTQNRHPWDTTPLLLGNCLELEKQGFHPTLRSAAERTAINKAFSSLGLKTQQILCNYANQEQITAEMEIDARAAFIFQSCSEICNLYGRDKGYKSMLRLCQYTLYYLYPNLRRTHDPTDFLQMALEKIHVNFYRLTPAYYKGYLIQTIKTRARDLHHVEGHHLVEVEPDSIPTQETDASEWGDNEAIPDPLDRFVLVGRKLTENRAIILEALEELKIAMIDYLQNLEKKSYRSRFQKLFLLLIYELGEGISQEALAELLGCSPQSISDWRKEYLSELPSVFKGLTEIW